MLKRGIRSAFRCPCAGEDWSKEEIDRTDKGYKIAEAKLKQHAKITGFKHPIGCGHWLHVHDPLIRHCRDSLAYKVIDPSLVVDVKVDNNIIIEAIKCYSIFMENSKVWKHKKDLKAIKQKSKIKK